MKLEELHGIVKGIAPVIRETIRREIEAERALLTQSFEERIASLPKPENGKDADPEVIRRQVADAVAAIPPTHDGESDLAALASELIDAFAPAEHVG